MGSSKKHKEKDGEHEHRHKHKKHHSHDRSRSRDRSRERRHSEKESRSGEKREKRRHRDRESSPPAEGQFVPPAAAPMVVDYGHSAPEPAAVPAPSSVQTKKELNEQDVEAFSAAASSGGSSLSLSIQQTNELRAKLGLKPLEADDGGANQDGSETKQDVHAPPVNMSEVRKTAELRDKMLQMREKRRLNALLGKVKMLGDDSDDEIDNAAAWVLKSRKIEEDRKEAERRAKMLEEMDSEFGIGGLIDEEFGMTKKSQYTSRDLKGLKVEHDQEMIQEGRTVILTLKDKGVLDDDAEDTLINVNLIDDEKAAKNVENKKKKPTYQAYDEPEFDEYGTLKVKDVLDKYDEVIDGVRKESFQLDDTGRYDTIYERNLRQMKASIHSQAEELSLPPMTIASEYYTPAEMEATATFKKVTKKTRKLRKKTRVKADDLVGLEQTTENDLGSRKRMRRDIDSMKEDLSVKMEALIPGLDVIPEAPPEDDDDDDDIGSPSEDLTGVVVDEDNAALELELSLSRARRLNQTKTVRRTFERDLAAVKHDDDADDGPTSIILNSTSEFCRSLGEVPTYGQAGNRLEDEEEEMADYEKEQSALRDGDEEEDMEGAGAWQSVEIDSRPVDITALPEKPVLDDEPIVNNGIAGALLLAQRKGYLDSEKLRKAANMNSSIASLAAQNYSIEDKKFDDDDKYSRKRADRFVSGSSMDFREKEGYKPEVKLEYVDEGGRPMSQKEAFRYLSHRFHGKGSGKKKLEKRLKKAEEDQMMKSMSSTDTPLNTVHLLQARQKIDKLPYIVLSGGKGIGANNIAK